MYTANILKPEMTNGALFAIVAFSNGTDTINDRLPILTEEDLNDRIFSKLESLNKLELVASKIKPGPYVPTAKKEIVIDPIIDAKIDVDVAYDNLKKGIIEQTDYDAIVSNYKNIVASIDTVAEVITK